MKTATIVKSAVTMAAIGTAAYMFNNTSARTKKKIKKTSVRALHSIGNIVDGISKIM